MIPAAILPENRPLTRRERLVLAWEIYAVYVRVRWLLARNEDVRDVLGLLRATTALTGATENPARLGSRLGRAVVRTLRLLPTDSRCLTRSLVLVRLLVRRGVTASLVLGVEPGEELFAHAWVEYEGRPLLEAGNRFKELARL